MLKEEPHVEVEKHEYMPKINSIVDQKLKRVWNGFKSKLYISNNSKGGEESHRKA